MVYVSEERLVADIPRELKDLVDADRRTNKEVVEAALWREFGGHSKSAMERRIEEKQKRIEMIREEREERVREENEQRRELAALESKVEEMRSSEDVYLDELDEILDRLEYNPRACHDVSFPSTEKLADKAPDPGHTAEDVMDDLRERAEEQGRDIRDDQWESDLE